MPASLSSLCFRKCDVFDPLPRPPSLYTLCATLGFALLTPRHQDVKLYDPAQHELIFTVANDSDACTQWMGSDGVVRWGRARARRFLETSPPVVLKALRGFTPPVD